MSEIGGFNIWGGDVVLGSRPQEDSDLPAIIGGKFQKVGPYSQMTYLEGKKRDLERSHRRAVGINAEDERYAVVQILTDLFGWRFLLNEESMSLSEPYTLGLWSVSFGATLNQWEVRKKGKWYRRKTK